MNLMLPSPIRSRPIAAVDSGTSFRRLATHASTRVRRGQSAWIPFNDENANLSLTWWLSFCDKLQREKFQTFCRRNFKGTLLFSILFLYTFFFQPAMLAHFIKLNMDYNGRDRENYVNKSWLAILSIVFSTIFLLIPGYMVLYLRTWKEKLISSPVFITPPKTFKLMHRKTRQIEIVFFFGAVASQGLMLFARSYGGPCTSPNDLSNPIFCNNEIRANSLPQDSAFALILLPGFLCLAAKGALSWEITMLNWFFSFLLLVACAAYSNAWNSKLLLLFSVFEFVRLLTVHWQNLGIYMSAQQHNRALMEKVDAENKKSRAEEMRNFIANMAHDLKSPMQAFTSSMNLLKDSINDAILDARKQEEAYGLTAAKGSRKTSLLRGFNGSSSLTSLHDVVENDGTVKLSAAESNLLPCLQILDDMLVTTEFMSMSINRALDYSKVSRGIALIPSYQSTDIIDSVEWAIKCVRGLQDNIAVVLKPLPEDVFPLCISDPQWLNENMLCVLSNAVKFSFVGPVEVSISIVEEQPQIVSAINKSMSNNNSVSVRKKSTSSRAIPLQSNGSIPERQRMLRFTVTDCGIGISPEAVAAAFRPMDAKRTRTDRHSGGAGLGLYSLAKRVEALGGSCFIGPRDDGKEGTMCWFTEPYRPDYGTPPSERDTRSEDGDEKTNEPDFIAGRSFFDESNGPPRSSGSIAPYILHLRTRSTGSMVNQNIRGPFPPSKPEPLPPTGGLRRHNSSPSLTKLFKKKRAMRDALGEALKRDSGGASGSAKGGGVISTSTAMAAASATAMAVAAKVAAEEIIPPKGRSLRFVLGRTSPVAPEPLQSPPTSAIKTTKPFDNVEKKTVIAFGRKADPAALTAALLKAPGETSSPESSLAPKIPLFQPRPSDQMVVEYSRTSDDPQHTGQILKPNIEYEKTEDRQQQEPMQVCGGARGNVMQPLPDSSVPLSTVRSSDGLQKQAELGSDAVPGANGTASAAEAMTATSSGKPPADQKDKNSVRRLKVLVVDDSITVLRSVRQTLEKENYVVETAPNGAVALDLLKEKRYDVVLMDIQMPVMDGIEAVQNLRMLEKAFSGISQQNNDDGPADPEECTTPSSAASEVSSATPGLFVRNPLSEPYSQPGERRGSSLRQLVIGVSANSNADIAAKAIEAGMDRFIAKPFSIKHFHETIMLDLPYLTGSTISQQAEGAPATGSSSASSAPNHCDIHDSTSATSAVVGAVSTVIVPSSIGFKGEEGCDDQANSTLKSFDARRGSDAASVPPRFASQAPSRQPSQREAHSTGKPSAIRGDSPTSPVWFPSLSILVVDDSLPILKTITRTLEKGRHNVETAQNGAIALDILKRRQFDVVLMDIQMPVMDGIEAVQQLRKHEDHVLGIELTDGRSDADEAGIVSSRRIIDRQLVIGVSANSDSETAAKALKAGMNRFMAKPFTMKQFQDAVASEIKGLRAFKSTNRGMFSRNPSSSNLRPPAGVITEGEKQNESTTCKTSEDRRSSANGTPFHRYDPLAPSRGASRAPSRRPSAAGRQDDPPVLPSLSVLVVDDSLPILRTITRTLEKGRHTVETAQNGAIALDILKQRKFDVVLMDIQMPVMDGIEAVQQLRKHEDHLLGTEMGKVNSGRIIGRQLVIGVSANSDSETAAKALKAGMNRFMAKPFTMKQFQDAVAPEITGLVAVKDVCRGLLSRKPSWSALRPAAAIESQEDSSSTKERSISPVPLLADSLITALHLLNQSTPAQSNSQSVVNSPKPFHEKESSS